jgi:FkbM family methyltransferase
MAGITWKKIQRSTLSAAASLFTVFARKGKQLKVFAGPLKGARILFHKTSRDISAFSGRWKRPFFETLSKLIHHRVGLGKGSIIFNVGAGNGFTELFLNRQLARRCRIYSFEPAAHASEALNENLRINHIENTEVIKKAVSHKIGMIDLHESADHHSSVIPECLPQTAQHRLVPTTTLDIFCKRNNTVPAFININIKGGAALALEGAEVTIEKFQPMIYVELHSQAESQAVAGLVKRFEYELFDTGANKWIKKDDCAAYFEQPRQNGLLLCPPQMKEDINYALFNKYRRDAGVADNWKNQGKPSSGEYAFN